ncbi:MAG: ABC transporter permease subunit [Acidimicrobiia bacterium]|nr:ABC transporter permease subunit [Acidimicrobiia bacterium]
MTRDRLRRVAGHLVLGVLALVSLFPLYWMFVTSLRPAGDVHDRSLWPWPVTGENYTEVWRTVPIGRMLLTTFQMAFLQTVGQLLTSLLAAYAFARYRFRGARVLFLLFVGTWLIPFQVTMIPNFVLLARLGWLNSVWAIVVPQLSAALAVIMLRQHLMSFPRELLDAARMDGAGPWRTLWRVVVPNLRAPLAALAILLFISAWNEYFWPLLVMNRVEDSVVQVGLQMFLSQEGDQWGPLMAAAGLASLPILVLYGLLQRHVVDAFVRSGLR